MPYITPNNRRRAARGDMRCAGDLNWLLHQHINRYINSHGESYQTYNDIMGVLECIKHELYTRLITPYEQRKLLQNGDCAPYNKQTNTET